MSYNDNRYLKMVEMLNYRTGINLESSPRTIFERVTSVIVPLDESQIAEHALPIAIALARRLEVPLRLVHVHTPMACVTDPIQLLSLGCREVELIHLRVAYLAQLVQRVEQAQPVHARASLIRGDRFDTTLSVLARPTDMVVMATREPSWWKRLTGSIVHPLSQQLACPLLVVPGYQSPVDITSSPMPTEIVVPLDGSAAAERIVPTASAMAQLYGARLLLLHVRSLCPSFPPKKPMHYLEQIARPLRDLHRVRTLVLESNGRTTAQVILSYLEVRVGSVLTMATPRGKSWKQLLRPGTGHTLLAKCPIPLLLQPEVRPLPRAAARSLQAS